MKKNIYLFFLLQILSLHLINAQLITYPILNDSLVEDNPSSLSPIESTFQNNYKVGKNTLFTVKVKELPNADWQELFVNNTFVNNTVGGNLENGSTNSSFVNFEFNGEVLLEITSPQTINSVIIRPISKNITKTVAGNKLTIKLTKPEKLSVEINGNRYENLHVFANELETIPDFEKLYPGKTIRTYETSGHMTYNKADNAISNKVIIVRAGTILKVPYETSLASDKSNGKIILNDNDILYIEGGGYLKGGVIIDHTKNVNVFGKGIIDISNFPKKYSHSDLPLNYAYVQGISIWNSNNVNVNGIIINDPQQCGIQIEDSQFININNSKIITRVLWGDGIQTKGSNNIKIDDTFIRSAEDNISIYASRYANWKPKNYVYRDTYNFKVDNVHLYADKAHPIQIGWHGLGSSEKEIGIIANPNNGNHIYDVTFNNVNILEHKEYGNDYKGAISVNCADYNTCSNFLFNNFNIEDFTNGRLITLIVQKKGIADAVTNGKHIDNVRFENINYNGNTMIPSVIKGLSCEEYVNGVFFENFKVNGNLVTKKEDYIFSTNQYAYNITFQEGNNYSTVLQNNTYYIKNETSNKYISYNPSTNKVELTTTLNINAKWKIDRVGAGEYRIQHLTSGKILENSLDSIYSIDNETYCQGRYLLGEDLNTIKTSQQWKINPNSNSFLINNAYTRAHLTQINNDIVAYPKKNDLVNQKWKMIVAPQISQTEECYENNTQIVCPQTFQIYPNPITDLLTIDFGDNNNISQHEYTTEIVDINGKIVLSDKSKNKVSFRLGNKLSKGYYIVNIYDTHRNKILSKKIIKN